MEGDKSADNDKELTSTSTSTSAVMGKFLSTNKDEKTDSNDTLPTSSTDASSTSIKSTHSVSDDPISSTSSEMDGSKSKPTGHLSTDVVDKASTSFDTEAELLGMSMGTQSSEKIEENVDDLVNDLETLLGESTDAFTIHSKTSESKDKKTEVTSAIQEELANLLGDKPAEDEVSSNTGANIDKVDTGDAITKTLVLDKDEDKNESVCDKPQKSDDNVPQYIGDVGNTVSSEDLLEACQNEAGRFQDGDNEESDKTAAYIEDDAEQSLENYEDNEKNEELIVPQITEDETNPVEEELPQEDIENVQSNTVENATLQQQELSEWGSEWGQEPEDASIIIFDDAKLSQNVDISATTSNQMEDLEEDTTANQQESSSEDTECLTKGEVVESQSTENASCSLEVTAGISESPIVEEDSTGLVQKDEVLVEEELGEIAESDTTFEKVNHEAGDFSQDLKDDEVSTENIEIAKEDNIRETDEEIEETSFDNQPIDEPVVLAQPEDAAATLEDIAENEEEVCNRLTEEEYSDTGEQEQHPQTASEESGEANKEDQVQPNVVAECEDDSSEVLQEIDNQGNIEMGFNPPETQPLGEGAHITEEDTETPLSYEEGANTTGDYQEPVADVKESIVDSLELQSSDQGEEHIEMGCNPPEPLGEGAHITEDDTKAPLSDEEGVNTTEVCLEPVEDVKEIIADGCPEGGEQFIKEHIVEDAIEGNVKDTDQFPDDNNSLGEEEDQVEVSLSNCEHVEDSKSIEEASETLEEPKPSQEALEEMEMTEVPADVTSREGFPKQALEEIEITELPADVTSQGGSPKQTLEEIEITEFPADVIDEAAASEADPVIEEPEENIQTNESLEHNDIEEVIDEENSEERLGEETENAAAFDADQHEPDDVEGVEEDKDVSIERSDQTAQEIAPSLEACDEERQPEELENIIESPTEEAMATDLGAEGDKDINIEISDQRAQEIAPSLEACDEESQPETSEYITSPTEETVATDIGAEGDKDINIEISVQRAQEIAPSLEACDEESQPEKSEYSITSPTEETMGTDIGAEEDKDVNIERSEQTAQEITPSLEACDEESHPEKSEDLIESSPTQEAMAIDIGAKPQDLDKIIAEKSNLDIEIIKEGTCISSSENPQMEESIEHNSGSPENARQGMSQTEESMTAMVDDKPELLEVDEEIENVEAIDDNIVESQESTSRIFKDSVQEEPEPFSNGKAIEEDDEDIVDPKTSSSVEQVVKPAPEINIRRKTVEQDLEKVVCLSEESSDSDASEPVRCLPKVIQDVPPFDEETNLIKIAGEMEQFPDPELPSEESSMPGIEEILSVQPQSVSTEAPRNHSSNLETILAVASLQSESVPEVRVERRLSEKEIREMEAIRMAVASITDSSQDTYDSYLVDNSVAMDNNIQDISNDAQEFTQDLIEVSNEPQIPSETIIVENTSVNSSSPEMLTEKADIFPDGVDKTEFTQDLIEVSNEPPMPSETIVDNTLLNSSCPEMLTENRDSDDKSEEGVSNLVPLNEGSNDRFNEAFIEDDGNVKNLDEAVDDNVEKIESIPSTDDTTSEVVDSVESKSNDEVTEDQPVESSKEIPEDSTPRLEPEEILQIAEGPEEPNVVVNDDKIVTKEADETPKEDIEDKVPEEIAKENVIPLDEEVASKQNAPLIPDLEDVSKEKDVVSISKEIVVQNVPLVQGVASDDKELSANTETIKAAVPTAKNDGCVSEKIAEEKVQVIEERPLRSRTRRGNKVSEPLSINIEEVADKKEKVYSPKITIKPVKVPDEEVSTTSDAEGNKGSLKMTITKQSDKMHSILKVYNPEEDAEPPPIQEEPIPKLIIKPKVQQIEPQQSPKMTTRSSKAYSPTSTRCSSPRITIKPIIPKATEAKCEAVSPLKITFKPVVKPEEGTKKHSPKTSKEQEQKNHNPKIIIKPIPKPSDIEKEEPLTTCTAPKVTIKPLKRHHEESEGDTEQERSSPKITIKPVVKPIGQDSEQLLLSPTMPKLKIKPIKKHDDEEPGGLVERDQGSSKISIKPVVKPPELEEEEEIKQRIVLKINKGSLPTPTKDPKKREYPEDDKAEKIGIKLKFSTTGGHTHIVQEEGGGGNKRQRKDSGYSAKEEPLHKRSLEERLPEKNKRLRGSVTPEKSNEDSRDGLQKFFEAKLASPIVLSEDSRSQHGGESVVSLAESNPVRATDISKIADIASRTTFIEASPVLTVGVATPTVVTATPPKKRGRPRKVPLQIREELADTPPPFQTQTTPVAEGATSTPGSDVGTPEASPSPGGRPKRSCRGQNVIATLGIKPRKPRGRGRGSKVNMGDREPTAIQTPAGPVQTVAMKPEKETKLSKAKLKLMQKTAEEEAQKQKEAELKRKTEETIISKAAQKKEDENKKIVEENPRVQIISPEEARSRTLQVRLRESSEKVLEQIPKREAISQRRITDEDHDASIAIKSTKDVTEEQSPAKKKKEEKTPPRKLEVTTRRQKAQQQKEAEDAEKICAKATSPAKKLLPILAGTSCTIFPAANRGVQKKATLHPPIESVTIEIIPNRPAAAVVVEEVVTISTDEDSSGKEISDTQSEAINDKPTESPNSPPKRPAEENLVHHQKKLNIELQKSDNEEVPTKQIRHLSETLEQGEKEEDIDASIEGSNEGDDSKAEGGASEEDEEESGDDSEAERRREWVLQKKQEAIKKCRAKRMEKLARAAELKRKRQEQAAQQREARKAAEEAEKAATERSRATKRYGRYGVPKPQISLIDAPIQETAGTIKSHMGLFNPESERLNITQPILIDDDNFDKEQPLKHIEALEKSPQKLLAPEPMVVDSADDGHQAKVRRSIGTEDVVMLDEETRMSADFRGSISQTPAKQAIPPPDTMVEDSQGSVGTEGGKSRSSKAPKMEVFQDLESTVFTADQLAEYSWNGQGPFMLQEQVAQYLGIKSFKRKYPQINRRQVDMQERDYLKENALATEAQCDLGLTAVNSQDILDIMYSDFQDKYEDYCRCQREKQARELANKQKALSQFSLKPGFDKLDILEQAVQSAAAWNQQFNKARREQRKAHMDLQSLTVHYPKSKMKVIPAPKIGHYPVALVPGQFTDCYKEFTPTELNNLPLNTMCYDEIKIPGMETDSEASTSGSESESEESSSGSSGSASSCDDEDCKECVMKDVKVEVNGVRDTDSADDVVIIENDASSSDSVVLVSVTAAPVTA